MPQSEKNAREGNSKKPDRDSKGQDQDKRKNWTHFSGNSSSKNLYSRKFPEGAEQEGTAWHSLKIEELFRKLKTSAEGLDPGEIEKRLEEYGKNSLPSRKAPGIVEIILHQFKNPLIYILLIAGVISFFVGDLKEAGFIFLVVLINSFIGTLQEWKAEQSISKMQSLLKTRSRVRRENSEKEVPAEEIVPGDIVLLKSGNRVPADVRILHAANFRIDESLLTGESVAVRKEVGVLEEEVPLSDRNNMAYAGTTVMTGRGCGVVTATGSDTEVGTIASAVTEAESAKPPLLIRMEDFARKVGFLVIAASGVVGTIAFLQGVPLLEVFFLAVALVVSAIPEALPVGITVALSIAASRMGQKNVIVRKLAAVESLGSCTTIATDKTGTLTVNEQTAREVVLPPGDSFEFTGAGYVPEGDVRKKNGDHPDKKDRERLKRFAFESAICNEGSLFLEDEEWVHGGDSIDVAFLAMAYKVGIDPETVRNNVRVVAEVPFESERRYSAVYYRENKNEPVRVAVKGAMEVVLPYCTKMSTNEGEVPVKPDALKKEMDVLLEAGYRVIALANGTVRDGFEIDDPLLKAVEPELVFLGITGFIDPLRSDVRFSILKCKDAGIDVVMITGDHPKTAIEIARKLEIVELSEEVMTGKQLEDLGAPELSEFKGAIENTKVFARVTPVQKMKIVDALVRGGHFVAVTGDGVNDAPALKRANIGVAMGSGTDVVKETSSMIITDDNFSSIVSGVEEGRIAYDNIRKVTYLLISTGFSEVILFMLAFLSGFSIPLLAVQLLWLNLVTNGVQDVALAFEAGEPGTMSRKPRNPEENIFNGLMVKQTLVSGLTIGFIAFAFWAWLLGKGYGEAEARNLLLLMMVLFENFHVFNCRSESRSVTRVPLRNNYLLVAGVILMQGFHILSMYIPFTQDLLSISPVSFEEWFSLLIVASIIIVVMEIFKKT